MRAYVMTRGTQRRQDYAFLGDAPPDLWWETVAAWVFLESEELVVRRRGAASTGLLISGIPSRRTDVIGTRIRFTVVVDDVHDDPVFAERLVRCGLDPAERAALGAALDTAFDADFVDARLAGGDGEVETPLLAALRQGTDGPDGAAETAAGASGRRSEKDRRRSEKDRRGSWAGDAGDETAVRAFRARVRRLLESERPGWAFATHAVGTLDGARRVAGALPHEVAVLLHDSDDDGELRGVEPLGKAPVPAGRRDTTGEPAPGGDKPSRTAPRTTPSATNMTTPGATTPTTPGATTPTTPGDTTPTAPGGRWTSGGRPTSAGAATALVTLLLVTAIAVWWLVRLLG
ncbi:hypothetical protein [Streptomyces sp. NPDC058653]|uniref:hypothetical protein n=1 Tax=Streptomyces sp. NPDC058653 TaxID=3346576 RepID=UPI0036653DD6